MKGNLSEEEIQATRKRVGQLLKEARERKCYTQQELADLMGIRQPTVASVERGEWSISLDKLTLFCKFLGLEMELKGTR